MEENNRPAPAVGDTANHPENGKEGRARRRGHRGGKRHHHGKERSVNPTESTENAPVASAEKLEKQAQRPAEDARREGKKNDRKNRDHNQGNGNNNNNKKNDKRDGKDNKGKKQNDRHGQKHRPDRLTQKDDIYGDPKEEKELAEWRAKIVLNATPEKAPTPAPVADEPEKVTIPEGIDLLGSDLPTPPLTEEETIEVVGIRFRSAGKMYYFAPGKLTLKVGDSAIVETARGPEFGDVCLGNSKVPTSKTVTPLRPILRVATEEDAAHNQQNREKEKEAFGICQKKIAEHKLDMKLIEAQYAFDNSKLLFYFSSEGRVDFRELVKDLASVFRTRIELRQIGIRDEAKMLGGFGACGRPLCCSTFLPDFAQVSIKMAKEQGLSLNSAKISGMCGRLMCCLRFETEVYAMENRLTPAIHSTVKTEDGIGTVISTNPLAGTVRVSLKDTPDEPPKQYHRDQVTVLSRERKAPQNENTDDTHEEKGD